MPDFRIYAAPIFLSSLEALQGRDKGQVEGWLRDRIYPQLRKDPYRGPAIKKLRDWSPDTWRYRVGTWRFFYEIDADEGRVFMTVLDRRSEGTYRR